MIKGLMPAFSILILLDLKASFSTVNHTAVATSLESSLNSSGSAQGIPQGSVLGPLPVGYIIHHHRLHFDCYAEDIQIYISTKSITSTIKAIYQSNLIFSKETTINLIFQ
ncbi:hypothetical protein AMECASPLE_034486 [Ameca splendens]|uniref:Reverse transcriptase domain-containing protein n=1 Tax=Ameca splendens TaxID=208324 RepID=A0ABV0YU71_9TELE